MITIKEYVEGLFREVPDSQDKENIIQEIILNLEEKVQDLMEQGKTEEDAINKSIVDFGDVSEIRKDLLLSADGYHVKKNKINYTNNLWFSIWGSVLIIGLFLFINFYYTPKIIWFVYPVFALLWWPLAMFFIWLNNRKKGNHEK
ncbi:MAG: hypothetical protein KAQ69_08105 [Spirochaetales bacterium]|nr:hypothetical protein [Spirochaetales bacterium]